MNVLKKILKWLVVLLVVINLVIIVSGRTYIYKAIANTYLKGRTKPALDDHSIFSNREVKAGKPLEWPVAKSCNQAAIPAALLEKFKAYETVAFLVIQHDSIRYEHYWDGFGEASLTNSFSVAKTVVGILTGIAIAEGKIKSIDQPVSDFLPAYKEGDNAKLTIRHLLTMSSGINFDESYANPFAYPAAAFYGDDLEGLTAGYSVTEEPGKVFRYLSGNTSVLSFVLKKATGKSLSEYASEKLWQPLGAKHDALWSLDHENGVEKAYCCFHSNARDFARIGQLYLDSGRWHGQQLVPEDYVLASVRPAELLDKKGNKNRKFGYSWWIIPDHEGHYVYYARGILGQYVFVIPDKDMVVVRLGHERDSEIGRDHPGDVFLYLDAALAMY